MKSNFKSRLTATALAAVLLFPASLLTLAAGFLYGPLWGTLLVSPTSVAASTVAFLLGRSVARDWINEPPCESKKLPF